MADGNKYKSVWRTGEAEERMQEYQRTVETALKKYAGDRQAFVKHMALFIVSEVRNERQMMEELGGEIQNIFTKFKV